MDMEKIEYDLPQLSLTVATMKGQPGKIFRSSHYHNAVELVCVHSGKITCYIGDVPVFISIGDVLLINKNVLHNIECSDCESDFSYIQIEMDRQLYTSKKDMNYIRKFIDKTSSNQYCIYDSKSELYTIFNNILNEFHSKKPYNTMYLQAYILQLNAFMHRYEFLRHLDEPFINKLEYIQPVIRFIDNHFTEKIYIEDLAAIIGCSKFHLCKQFKSLTNGTVVDYINFVRLQHSAERLLHSSETITDIAYSSGFSSVQYFNKKFKEYFGCSPKKFKVLHT